MSKLGKRLRVLKDGKWEYVFCYNYLTGIVVTQDPRKALKARDLKYFQSTFGNDVFRVR